MKGKIKEPDFKKEIGMFEGEVIAINPDREELGSLLGRDIEDDLSYVGESKKGDPTVRISIWFKDKANEKKKRNATFYLENRVRTNKDETKIQYINCVGVTTWIENDADPKAKLPNWFKHFTKKEGGSERIIGDKSYRRAIVGEEELMNFIKAWSKIDIFDPESELLLDTSKLFKGNVREMSQYIGTEDVNSICAMLTVREVMKDTGQSDEEGNPIKEAVIYQTIYPKEWLAGWNIKFFRGTEFTEDRIDDIREKTKKLPFEKFIVNVTDKEHGCKLPVYLGEAKEYNPTESFIGNDAPMIEEDSPGY